MTHTSSKSSKSTHRYRKQTGNRLYLSNKINCKSIQLYIWNV